MELVYLWVEDYKNIKNQGFNFSPRFKCDYNPETNELTINENDDYIENFFGENINVTAIVGKNGSGKSSVLFQEQGQYGQAWTKNFKIIFKNNTLELLEPFRSFWYEDYGPYAKVFKIINNTKYKYIKRSIYEEVDLSKEETQDVLGKANDNRLDDKFSIYFDSDIFKYLNTNDLELYIMGSDGFQNIRPNSFKSILEQKINYAQNTQYLEPYYEVNTNNLENKINNIIKNNNYNFLELIDFKIEKDYNFLFDLSSGQRFLILLFSLLIDKAKELNLIIYLDEPDTSLHPQWQKDFINKLIKIFSINKQQKIHFIITTHSPFLLSDIPKQNIIFLDTDENGNCIVADGLKEKKQTFGANIHTLLSDSFFMEDGLMGEFAKSKINEIIEFHSIVSKGRHKECLKKIYEKRKTKFWQTQSVIGEEYLKQVIKNHLVEIEKILFGKDKAKEEEIKRVEKYLESLKND